VLAVMHCVMVAWHVGGLRKTKLQRPVGWVSHAAGDASQGCSASTLQSHVGTCNDGPRMTPHFKYSTPYVPFNKR
jgi:hypothetical protein